MAQKSGRVQQFRCKRLVCCTNNPELRSTLSRYIHVLEYIIRSTTFTETYQYSVWRQREFLLIIPPFFLIPIFFRRGGG